MAYQVRKLERGVLRVGADRALQEGKGIVRGSPGENRESADTERGGISVNELVEKFEWVHSHRGIERMASVSSTLTDFWISAGVRKEITISRRLRQCTPPLMHPGMHHSCTMPWVNPYFQTNIEGACTILHPNAPFWRYSAAKFRHMQQSSLTYFLIESYRKFRRFENKARNRRS